MLGNAVSLLDNDTDEVFYDLVLYDDFLRLGFRFLSLDGFPLYAMVYMRSTTSL
jgi:hypothetical protein